MDLNMEGMHEEHLIGDDHKQDPHTASLLNKFGEYDPFLVPPNVELAKAHGKSLRLSLPAQGEDFQRVPTTGYSQSRVRLSCCVI